jgi:hypothetical protein
MEACVKHRSGERRCSRRLCRADDHRIAVATVRPGHRARVIDVSAGGVLIETNHRLLPGSSVELHVQFASFRTTARGRVVRCSVSGVRPTAIAYRGAIAFDRHLPWFVDNERRHGDTCCTERPAHPFRAEATPEAM